MQAQTSGSMSLPVGWKREEVVRQSGLSAGRTDVYYLTPDGRRVKSKPQLARLLGESIDLSTFDFRSGRNNYNSFRKNKRHKASSYDFARGVRVDASLVLPIRQTASIFKQPVTVVKNRPESKTKTDLKQSAQEQPRQLFWEKRLQGLRACDKSEEVIPSIQLPKQMLQVGPELSTENILQSISAALHVNTGPVVGQTASKQAITKNPGVVMDAHQPHIQQMVVKPEDIIRQEQRVMHARRQLKELIESLK